MKEETRNEVDERREDRENTPRDAHQGKANKKNTRTKSLETKQIGNKRRENIKKKVTDGRGK